MNVYRETSLEKAFEFTPDDLQQNQRGELSAAQRDRIRRHAGQIALIVLAVLGVIGILTILSAQPESDELPVFLIFLIGPAAITLALTVGLTEVALSPRVVAKRNGQIKLAYGIGAYDPPLDQEQQRRARRWIFGRAGACTMVVGDKEFQLSREQFNSLTPGLYVAIYYVPTIHRIVSIDVIDDGTQLPPSAIEIVTTAQPGESIPAAKERVDDRDGDVIRG
jgi:hypothetical protein